MRLFSWNVNGVRSVHGKGFEDWFIREAPDVVCLQEIKAHPDQLADEVVHPAGYHSYWFPAEKRGYSGVCVYSKSKPRRVRHGLGVSEFDREGRVLTLEFGDFTLVNAYFPNSQRDHARLDFKLDFCDRMLGFLDKLRANGRSVVLCGDLNIAHKEIDLRYPRQNVQTAGFLPEERAWMDRFLDDGYVDTFRQFEPGPGHYTWWSYRPGVRAKNIGWRIDYFVCNAEMRHRLVAARHHCEVMGSDHCPIELAVSDD